MGKGFFRYPGGKMKLSKTIVRELLEMETKETVRYVEPFFGGGGVGLSFLAESKYINEFVFGDLDFGIYSIWKSVKDYPHEFARLIMDFRPTLNNYYSCRDFLLGTGIFSNNSFSDPDRRDPENKDIVLEYALAKLAAHQLSYSGLGLKSGGPLGGKEQKSKYKIDCRWSPDYMRKKIEELHEMFSQKKITITNKSYSEYIGQFEEDTIAYLDPPYYVNGPSLYYESFSIGDHDDLCDLLRNAKFKWLLSYDFCPEIETLYEWAETNTIEVPYSINTSGSSARRKREFLIRAK